MFCGAPYFAHPGGADFPSECPGTVRRTEAELSWGFLYELQEESPIIIKMK